MGLLWLLEQGIMVIMSSAYAAGITMTKIRKTKAIVGMTLNI
jgi:hypothetical protein